MNFGNKALLFEPLAYERPYQLVKQCLSACVVKKGRSFIRISFFTTETENTRFRPAEQPILIP